MAIHTYRARTLAEALLLVRQELGPAASVLSTREVSTGWSRWLSGTQIEVTASADVRVPSQLSQPELSHVPAAELTDFRRQFRRDLADRASDESSLVEQLASHHPEASARRCFDRRDACGTIRLRPGRQTVVALVGPTGVGKTTTIAKLAARFRLQDRCRVGLVTTDTFRIAAIEQLEGYAQIIDVPLEVAASASELTAALGRLANCDLVLIDTAGISPHDAPRLAELHDMLAHAACDQIHLVLSAASGHEILHAAASAFTAAGASALIVTKLDEATTLDDLSDLSHKHQLPLSYTTSGQSVPDDLQPAGDNYPLVHGSAGASPSLACPPVTEP